MYFHIESVGSQYRWFLIASNGKEVARYADWYKSKKSCINAVRLIAKGLSSGDRVPVIDHDKGDIVIRKHATH